MTPVGPQMQSLGKTKAFVIPPVHGNRAARSCVQRQQHAVLVTAASQNGHHAADQAPRRVVVTGLGVVSCLGQEPDEFYNNLLKGHSGITMIENWDAEEYPTRFAGEIKSFSVEDLVSKKMERRLDKALKYTLVAGKKALAHAGLPWDGPELDDINRMRCGILIGSAMGGMTSWAAGVEALTLSGYRKMNPFCVPFSITNMGGAMLAMDLGFMGPNYSISTACATGNYCIISAADHIRRGEADLMLAGGTDAAIIPSGMGGFSACKALSTRNEEPASASRPWDKNRDGFVMGEGSGVLVLEEYEHAKARGATIIAEYVGGAVNCDAHHMTEPRPDGRGVAACIQSALESSGISAGDVTYVNAHATSTPAGDLAEYRAIRTALPGDQLRINSSKSMIGHLLGAAGAVEAVATVKAIETGYVHPNLNLQDPEEEVDLNIIVGNERLKLDINVALSNSFGFGGHNSCVMFKKFSNGSAPAAAREDKATTAMKATATAKKASGAAKKTTGTAKKAAASTTKKAAGTSKKTASKKKTEGAAGESA